MGRVRITRLFVLLALAALLAPRAEASRTSVWESNPPASLTATTTDTAGLLASLAPAAAGDFEAEESPRFNLGDVILADTTDADAERFDLGPLTLVDLNLLRGPPPSYPETRVGGFELLPPFRVGASASLSLWGRQACGFVCREVVSDSREDPWGLAMKASPAALGWLEQEKAAGEDFRELKWLLRPSVLKANWTQPSYLREVASKIGGVLLHSARSAIEAPGSELAGVGITRVPEAASVAARLTTNGPALVEGAARGERALAASAATVEGVGGTGGSAWAETRYSEWFSSLKTKPTPSTSPQNLFEITHTGPVNYLVEGGGEKLWADGVRESRLLEAKMIVDPKRSPFLADSKIPLPVRQKILGEVRDEFRRAAEILKDPANPLDRMDVVTNSEEAKPFFESLMKEYGIPGQIHVRK